MNPFLHAMNIGTLATWLSVAGFGTVGLLVPHWRSDSPLTKMEAIQLVLEDFTLGNVSPETHSDAAPADSPLETAQTPLQPPEMPMLAKAAALPEIPDLPTPAAKPAERKPRSESTDRPTAKPNPFGPTSGRPAPFGKSPHGNAANSGMSDSARLAAGHMPPPSYPPEARRNRQTGTVLVEFTVDASGHVISAYAKSPSPWPLLDAEAVRAVRRWTFPAGSVMKRQKPIVFQLR